MENREKLTKEIMSNSIFCTREYTAEEIYNDTHDDKGNLIFEYCDICDCCCNVNWHCEMSELVIHSGIDSWVCPVLGKQ